MTEHIELYKKYRPRSWSDLIGQEKVAKSLQLAVKANKLPTAYLFSGERGVGKTSAALLLAKSLNCLNLDKKANPCGECDVCSAVDTNTQLGVHYISAANTGSVDDIRGIVQKARLHQPLRKQVWIIDEVHSISRQAFDALLIPLEEESMPSLFIFCTTEIDRIPQTILSRVQQRRFMLVESETMLNYVKEIADKEAIDLDESLLQDSVRQGRGSVRDTLTALEEIISTGEYAKPYGGQLLDAIAANDLTKSLAVIAEANANNNDSRDIAEQLFIDLRDLLLYSSQVDSSLIGIIPTDERAFIKGVSGKRGIMLLMDEVGDALTQMTMGADARIHLEIGLIKGFTQLKRLKKAIESKS